MMTELVERKSSRRKTKPVDDLCCFPAFCLSTWCLRQTDLLTRNTRIQSFSFLPKPPFFRLCLLLRSSEALLFSIISSLRPANHTLSEAIILATSSHMIFTISSYCRCKVLCDVFHRDLNEPMCSNFLTKISPNKTI